MVLLDVVYLSMNWDKSYGNVTLNLMEGIMLEIEPLTRYCSLDFIGLLSSRMLVSLSHLVMNCQRIGNSGKRKEMPMNYSLAVEPFDVWGFDYMRPFPSSNGYTHILVAVDLLLNG